MPSAADHAPSGEAGRYGSRGVRSEAQRLQIRLGNTEVPRLWHSPDAVSASARRGRSWYGIR